MNSFLTINNIYNFNKMTKNVNINNKTKKYLLSHTKKDEIAVNIL